MESKSTAVALPPPGVEIIGTELFPLGHGCMGVGGQILQAQNIAIMAVLQEIRIAVVQPPKPSREVAVFELVIDDEISASLVRPTKEWMNNNSGKRGSDTHRLLHSNTTTRAMCKMAFEWFHAVVPSDKKWDEATALAYFKHVSKLIDEEPGEKSKAKPGRKRQRIDQTSDDEANREPLHKSPLAASNATENNAPYPVTPGATWPTFNHTLPTSSSPGRATRATQRIGLDDENKENEGEGAGGDSESEGTSPKASKRPTAIRRVVSDGNYTTSASDEE